MIKSQSYKRTVLQHDIYEYIIKTASRLVIFVSSYGLFWLRAATLIVLIDHLYDKNLQTCTENANLIIQLQAIHDVHKLHRISQ